MSALSRADTIFQANLLSLSTGDSLFPILLTHRKSQESGSLTFKKLVSNIFTLLWPIDL